MDYSFMCYVKEYFEPKKTTQSHLVETTLSIFLPSTIREPFMALFNEIVTDENEMPQLAFTPDYPDILIRVYKKSPEEIFVRFDHLSSFIDIFENLNKTNHQVLLDTRNTGDIKLLELVFRQLPLQNCIDRLQKIKRLGNLFASQDGFPWVHYNLATLYFDEPILEINIGTLEKNTLAALLKNAKSRHQEMGKIAYFVNHRINDHLIKLRFLMKDKILKVALLQDGKDAIAMLSNCIDSQELFFSSQFLSEESKYLPVSHMADLRKKLLELMQCENNDIQKFKSELINLINNNWNKQKNKETLSAILTSKITPVTNKSFLAPFIDTQYSLGRCKINNVNDDIERACLYYFPGNQVIELKQGDEKKLYQVNKDVDISLLIHLFLSDPSCVIDRSHAQRGCEPEYEDSFEDLLVYNGDVDIVAHYKIIHRDMTNEIIKTVKEKNLREIYLVFIACGQGKEIKTVCCALDKIGVKYAVYGFDVDAANVKSAQKRLERFSQVSIEKNSAKNIQRLLNKFDSTFSRPVGSTFVVSSGFLTSRTSQTGRTQEVFEMMRHIATFLRPEDKFLISGRTASLCSAREGKLLGLSMTQQRHFMDKSEVGTLNVFTKQDIPAQTKKIAQKIDKFGQLYLRDHMDVLSVLLELEKNYSSLSGKVHTIDLRDAQIPLEDMPDVRRLLLAMNAKIIVTGCEKWASYLNYWQLYDRMEIQANNFTHFMWERKNKNKTVICVERQKLSDNAMARFQLELKKTG